LIDPDRITDFSRSPAGLEELALFCPLTIGTNAHQAARTLARALGHAAQAAPNPPWSGSWSPLDAVRHYANPLNPGGALGVSRLRAVLAVCGARFHHVKARSWAGLTGLDKGLAEVHRDDLVRIPGFSYKTASLFLLHSRKGWRGACLDRHILRKLARLYPEHDVPPQAPQSWSRYAPLERLFLRHCDQVGREPHDLDLAWWRELRRKEALCPSTA
jgi:hypothetical protein